MLWTAKSFSEKENLKFFYWVKVKNFEKVMKMEILAVQNEFMHVMPSTKAKGEIFEDFFKLKEKFLLFLGEKS